MILQDDDAIGDADVGEAQRRPPALAPTALRAATLEPLRIARRAAADDFERAYLSQVLEQAGGNVRRAAALAEVSRQMIQKLMRKHGQ